MRLFGLFFMHYARIFIANELGRKGMYLFVHRGFCIHVQEDLRTCAGRCSLGSTMGQRMKALDGTRFRCV